MSSINREILIKRQPYCPSLILYAFRIGCPYLSTPFSFLNSSCLFVCKNTSQRAQPFSISSKLLFLLWIFLSQYQHLNFPFLNLIPFLFSFFLIPLREKPYNLESIWHRCLCTIISLVLFNCLSRLKKVGFRFVFFGPSSPEICLKRVTTKIHSRFGMVIFLTKLNV